MVKAIFFDIDGTLVSFQTHCIPTSTRQALEELHHRGIKLFIATGRPKWLMMHAIGNLPFDGFITLNGVHCFTSNRKDIHKDCIPQEDINRLIDFHKENPDMPFVFVHDNTWFITHVNKDVEEISRYIEVELPPVFPIEKAAEKDILQIMGYFTPDNDQTLFKSVLPHCQPMRWHPLFTDIISKGNSKSNGIDKILDYYDIDITETMAFGDGGNDISMLSHVNIGVAMGNAAEKVQAAAKYVTTSVDEDGIMNALKHFKLL